METNTSTVAGLEVNAYALYKGQTKIANVVTDIDTLKQIKPSGSRYIALEGVETLSNMLSDAKTSPLKARNSKVSSIARRRINNAAVEELRAANALA